MTRTIVEPLEPIDIDKQQSGRSSALLLFGNPVGRSIDPMGAIGETCQTVVRRPEFDFQREREILAIGVAHQDMEGDADNDGIHGQLREDETDVPALMPRVEQHDRRTDHPEHRYGELPVPWPEEDGGDCQDRAIGHRLNDAVAVVVPGDGQRDRDARRTGDAEHAGGIDPSLQCNPAERHRQREQQHDRNGQAEQDHAKIRTIPKPAHNSGQHECNANPEKRDRDDWRYVGLDAIGAQIFSVVSGQPAAVPDGG